MDVTTYCRVWDDGLGTSRYVCNTVPDDDVVGHASPSARTATVSITWTEKPDGERRVEFTSEDPDAQAILMELINASKEMGDQTPAAR